MAGIKKVDASKYLCRSVHGATIDTYGEKAEKRAAAIAAAAKRAVAPTEKPKRQSRFSKALARA